VFGADCRLEKRANAPARQPLPTVSLQLSHRSTRRLLPDIRTPGECVVGLSNRESDVLSGCLQWLRLKGVFCWRQNQGAIPLKNGGYRRFVGLRGVSDILGILPQTVRVVGDAALSTFGNMLAVETKRPGEGLRPEQAEFLRLVNERGGIGLCVRSVTELEQRLGPYLSAEAAWREEERI
jgi:hypothetical protein